MSKAQHTPGPWEWGEGYSGLIGGNGDYVISYADYEGMWLGAERDTNDANARLIAAAPDLLDALQQLSDQSDRLRFLGQPLSDAEKAARAAIKKARGA